MAGRILMATFVAGACALSWPGGPCRADGDGGSGEPQQSQGGNDGQPGQPPLYVSPAAKEVLDRAVLMMGGAAALNGITGVDFDCTMVGDQGTMIMKVAARKNHGVRVEQWLTPPGADQALQHMMLTTNMQMGWARDLQGDGLRIMPGEVMSSVAKAGDLWNMVLSGTSQFAHVEHDGAATFASRPCAKLVFTQPRTTGLQKATVYFDDETGLPLGQETATAMDVLIAGTARIDEWQTVDGLMVPKKIAVEGQMGSSVLTFDRLAFNNVPTDIFSVPDDVVQLAAASAAGNQF